MKEKYNHQKIEIKWQKYWKENGCFLAKKEETKPKYYVLDMFPYPSGAGLHVGHVTGYTGTDILARYMRQKGYNVLHPMGWDSFGLPAEQYAIRTGTHPSITTKKNIETYKKQLNLLGFSYDWSRELATSDASYYKWTQWIFTKLYEMDLAYEASMYVNYCPHLKTILANEEIEEGKSKEGGHPIERILLKQWILKITKYAQRLLEDLNDLDWPENIKKLQKNWIGKSEGANIVFQTDKNLEIEVFTTRPDTIFGATFLVLSCEHPLVEKLTTEDKKNEVKDYKKKAALKSDLQRTDLATEKTGVFLGSYAINPVNQKKIPIWISDYVLMGYATGSIMAVPSGDERDFEFAKKFNIPIKCIIDPDLTGEEDLLEPKEDIRKKVLNSEICWTKKGKLINSFNNNISIDGLDISSAKEKIIDYLEKNHLGKKTISYKLRDWLFSRQRYWGEPIPILHFEDGTKRTLELDELPLIQPSLDDYTPKEKGKSPLANQKAWVEIIDPKTKKKAKRDINTMPQWAGSCWYYLRFLDPKNEKEIFSKDLEMYWMPVDIYVGGAEHAVLHLLYARFWHKVLYDLKLVSTKEPFKKYRYQGLVTAPSYKIEGGCYVHKEDVQTHDGKLFYNDKPVNCQIEKMSKSKLNGQTPDESVEEYGADAIRLYEMFMGPFDKEKIWNSDAISGCKRFLNRFFEMIHSDKVSKEDTEEGLKLSHRLANIVSHEIESMQFNTAIAHLMEFINSFSKLEKYPIKALKMAIQMLYPFAPHISEELWQYLGEKNSLTNDPLIKVEHKYLHDETTTYIIQVNGKLRAKMELALNIKEDEIIDLAKKEPNVQKHLANGIIKTIFVPKKLLNIVAKK